MKKVLLAILALAFSVSAIGQGTVVTPAAGPNAPPLLGHVATSNPATCQIGSLYFKSNATAGSNIYGCTAANTWTAQGSSFNPVSPGPIGGTTPSTGAFTTLTATTINGGSTGGTITPGNTAGLGPAIAAGTATTDVAALSITRTNNNAAVATGVDINITDTLSAAGYLPFQVRNGATALFNVDKSGNLTTGSTGHSLTLAGGSLRYGFNYAATFELDHNVVLPTISGTGPTGVIGFGATNGFSLDTGASRISAGIVGFGTGAAASIAGGIQLASIGLSSGHIADSATAPSIASGFGGSPSIVANNGTAAFTVNVGTGGAASSGVITMPTATTGWLCLVTPSGAPQAAAVTYSAPTSATSVTLTNYTLTTGIALAWTASLVLEVHCRGY